MKTFLLFLVLVLQCPNTVTKTIYGYSMELSTSKKETTALIHADTDGDKIKDFKFLIGTGELKSIRKKMKLPYPSAQFYQIETLDGDCFYVFESFKTKKK